MSPEIPSTPAPTDVAELVRRLISSPWPTTETERRAWFAQNGLDMTEKATEGDFVVAEGPSVWGKPRGGWHFHDGEFVGLYWFLWAGESWATVVAPAATQLQDLFSGIAGSPVDVGEASGPATGFRASWTVDGYSIEIDVRPWSRPGRGCAGRARHGRPVARRPRQPQCPGGCSSTTRECSSTRQKRLGVSCAGRSIPTGHPECLQPHHGHGLARHQAPSLETLPGPKRARGLPTGPSSGKQKAIRRPRRELFVMDAESFSAGIDRMRPGAVSCD